MKRILLLTVLHLITTSVFAQKSKQTPAIPTIASADSLFSLSQWQNAIPMYESILKATPANSLAWNRLGFCYHNTGELDKALLRYQKAFEYNPTPQLLATIHSRMARIYSTRKEPDNAFSSLDKALTGGYLNVVEMENHRDFDNLRADPRFEKAVTRARTNAMPCLTHEQSRQFDFWIGDWDVYLNGANVIIGKSKIEMASGGCMILGRP